MEEIILVDTRDRIVGSCEKLAAHRRPTLHRAFSVFLYADGQMLLQRRNRNKYHSGGLWTNACCSHPRKGETLEASTARRMVEELGVSVPLTEVFSFVYCARFADDLWEHECDHVFVGEYRGMPQFDPEEAEEMRWISFADLRRELVERAAEYTPWFHIAAPRVLDLLEKRS